MALIRDGDLTAVVYHELARKAGHTGTAAEMEAAGRKIVDGLGGGKAKGKAGDGGKPSKAERRIALAERHGYKGSPEQLESKGREIRRAVKELPTEADREQAASLGKAEMDQLLAMTSAQRMTLGMSAEEIAAIERSLADDDAELTKLTAKAPTATAKTAAPTPAPTNLGMGADGVFRCTSEQLRDPLFGAKHQAALASGRFEIVDSPSAGLGAATPGPSARPGMEFNPYEGLIPMNSPWRDPAWCMANQERIAAKSKEVMRLPIGQAGAVLESITK